MTNDTAVEGSKFASDGEIASKLFLLTWGQNRRLNIQSIGSITMATTPREIADGQPLESKPTTAAKPGAAASILSKEPDFYGYYYGFYESDPRQINVRPLKRNGDAPWLSYVGDDFLGNTFQTKTEAEAAAIEYLRTGRRPTQNTSLK